MPRYKEVAKELPVVPPLRVAKGKKLAWPEAKGFANHVCLRMARENSQLYLIKMTKNQRNGLIFFDYLQRSHGDCCGAIVARARPGAAVSMPLP